MYLFGKESIVKHWVGPMGFRYRWPIVLDALKYLRRAIRGVYIAPKKVKVRNPAFDVTEAGNITAIITEKGVIESPDTEKVASHLMQQGN